MSAGQVTLTDIPRVEQVQRRLYELVEADAEAEPTGSDNGDGTADAKRLGAPRRT